MVPSKLIALAAAFVASVIATDQAACVSVSTVTVTVHECETQVPGSSLAPPPQETSSGYSQPPQETTVVPPIETTASPSVPPASVTEVVSSGTQPAVPTSVPVSSAPQSEASTEISTASVTVTELKPSVTTTVAHHSTSVASPSNNGASAAIATMGFGSLAAAGVAAMVVAV